MAKDFEIGQKAYLCFNKPELVTVVKLPFFSNNSMSMRMEVRKEDGTILDPVPSLVFHSKLQYYQEHKLPILESEIKKVKAKIKRLQK